MLTRRTLAVLVTMQLVFCTGKKASFSERTISVGSHSLHAVVAGDGSPAVVIDGGIGALCNEYRELQKRISATTRVVTYDRAGYGLSEVGPLPRDSRKESTELKALLSGLGILPPYILVGHSLGGLNAQVYTDLFPNDVAGLILLDPPPLSFILGEKYTNLGSMARRMTEEWQGIADRGIHSENEQDRARALFFQMLASEHREMFAASARYAASISTFGDIPLVVVASGVPNPVFGKDADAYQKYWVAQSRALTSKSSRGQFVFAETSTHRLHDDAIDLVTDKILSMVKSLK